MRNAASRMGVTHSLISLLGSPRDSLWCDLYGLKADYAGDQRYSVRGPASELQSI